MCNSRNTVDRIPLLASLEAFRIYYVIFVSASSLHGECTDSPICYHMICTCMRLTAFIFLTISLALPLTLPIIFRVEAICVLNQQRVYEDFYNIRRDSALLGLCMDPCDVNIYTYQKHRVWAYTPFNETR